MSEPHRGIEAQDLGRSFGEVEAVKDVSFSVEPGEVVGLLGPNGAGKTTTLRMLATLLRPSKGTARIDGHDILEAPLEVRRSVGYLTGDTGLYGRLSPIEFLTYFGELYGMDRATIARHLDRTITLLGIGDFANKRCETLSTGQQQRVSISRAVFHDPAVLLLDEPTSGLDILSARNILAFFRAEADRGKAVILSTHILSEVELICDRAIIIHRGVVRHRGTLTELLEQSGATHSTEGFFSLLGEEASSTW